MLLSPLAYTTIPVFYRATLSRDRTATDLSLCRLVLALQDYRDAHGEYPPDLTSLPPARPALNLTDPFGGKPFVYRREGKGFVVYSLSQDLVDNGGRPDRDEQGRSKETGDIVWRCAG